MSVVSFLKCHDKIEVKLKSKYAIRYYFGGGSPGDNSITLWALVSDSPGKLNATKTIKFLIHLAEKHNIKIELMACSRYVDYETSNTSRNTRREFTYAYWRALNIYQKLGFKPIAKESFLSGIIQEAPVWLTT